jgi:hypothetical protein
VQERDLELEGWQRQWRTQDAVPADLAKTVAAGTRSLRRGLIAEIIVTIVMGGGATAWATMSSRPDVTVLAIAIWILLAVAWAISILLRRGAWQPVASTTAAFVDVSILRCERSLQAIWIQAVLYVVIFVFDLVWLYSYLGFSSVSALLTRPAVIVFVTVVSPMLAGAAVWYRRRLLRELKNLTELKGQARESL